MMQLKKLIFECEDENGKRYKRVLEGEDVDRWNEYMLQVCIYAENNGQNPKWHELEWKQTEVKPSKSKMPELLENHILLTELLEENEKRNKK